MNWVEISRSAITANYLAHVHERQWDLIIPVLKSNAYGHGLKQLCQIIDNIPECEVIAVDSYPEYLTVYHHTTKDILLIGETEGSNYRYFDPKRTVVWVYNAETLQKIINLSKPFRIHLFLNTGMNREWVQTSDLPALLELLNQPHRLTVDGVMSHFATSDSTDGRAQCEQQITKFKSMYAQIEQAGHRPRYRHINNSSGFVKNNDHRFNAHRIGKWLYGMSEYTNEIEFQSFADTLRIGIEVYSTVNAIQHIQEQEGVSYSYTWSAPFDTTVATIPFGYYEGLTRTMSNQRSVEHQWVMRSLVGNISMNMATLHDPSSSIKLWDTIKVISSDPTASNSWSERARLNHTIPREALVKLNPLIKRVIVD